MTDRSSLLQQWLAHAGYRDYHLQPASEDASFRSYLRLDTSSGSFIIMDAPPAQEPCDRFISVAGKIRAAGLNAPEIIDTNLDDGFLLLTDFGSEDYLSILNEETAGRLYADALDALLVMQREIDPREQPPYDEALLLREMDLFHDWFLLQLLGLQLDEPQQALWNEARQVLVDNALAQPRVFVHRDYHSRNLMVLAEGNPGILDFQDAMNGPVTYDLVSLLRDCYIAWPQAWIDQQVMDFHARMLDAGLITVTAEEFHRWFNLMGVQRHLKAVGIFSRLKIRDGKQRYLADIPRTLGYIHQVSRDEPSLAGLAKLLDELQLEPRIEAILDA